MNETATTQNIVVRTGRGLTIAGTRITLYSIMDYIKADWPPKLIKDLFDLTDVQISGVLAYIEANRDEVESEYQFVLQKAEENRRYWTEYNREHLEKVAAMPHKPEHEEIWAKLKAWQAKLETA
ncbi:MAG: DUF433 domain-containing protein [Deltaproteobacteria bacterium]|nr:DUF433 domain-containing protein [Deltaproteobacteria bacterium]